MMIVTENNIRIYNVDNICVSLDQAMAYFNNHNYNENMFTSDGKINPNYNSNKKTGLIAKILDDHWSPYYSLNKEKVDKYRSNADYEVQKVINCYNKNLGCSVYECPTCHDAVFIGHTCKSRFCSSCGYKYKLERTESILETAYNCNHRQIVFTIPAELRVYFFYPYEERINILFKAVEETIYSILNDSYKNKNGKKKEKIFK